MRVRALFPCALSLLLAAPVAHAAGHPVATTDTTPPAATHIRVSGGRLRFTLSENASFRAHLVRAGRSVRQLGVALRAGTIAYRLPRRLRAGRYAIRFVLTDRSGNHSRTYAARFSVH